MPRRNRRLIGQTTEHRPEWPKARVRQLHRELLWRMQKIWRNQAADAARAQARGVSVDGGC